MKVKTLKELPENHCCKACGEIKPLAMMVVIYHKREQYYYVRPRCKDCHNAHEQGHRREWKRAYLQKWRRKNAALTRSYWDNPEVKEQVGKNAKEFWQKNRAALLIKGRLQRRGEPCTIAEAREYLQSYGPNYPTIHGLTATGRKEVERIRSTMRRSSGKILSTFEIRLMVYEDGLEDTGMIVKASAQKFPYKKSSQKLSAWHQRLRDRKEPQ